MSIGDLKVAHWAHFAKKTFPVSSPVKEPAYDARRVFHLSTCQRDIWIYRDAPSSNSYFSPEAFPQIELFSGESAYELLLSIACGLESRILGETNIFGQIKEAWERFSAEPSNLSHSRLTPVFQKLFEDTKDIRSQFLRNAGGNSYGALVRKLIKERSGLKGPILLLGAGDIAHSVAPWLLENELWIINRDRARAEMLREKLAAHPEARVRVIEGNGEGNSEEAAAFAQAAHCVVCIPFDGEHDPERARLWGAKPAGALVVHLSGPRAQAGAWLSIPNFHCLDDLFALQESGWEARDTRLRQARRACGDRAKLRALGSSLSIAHGWEYLAVFG